MSRYIIFWKDSPGQQVSTVVDAHNQPVLRDDDYLETNDIPKLYNADHVFTVLDLAEGQRFAIEPELARVTLGWDV